MRESNFAFPAQNKACVCITSQLYDRRALDTTAPLPLFNSLTHLTYLTSTSPRIREIMTMDGGLERLVKLLQDFCFSPPPPENPTIIYGLLPPSARPPKSQPTLNPPVYDKHAAYRFSLAFQCVVNIGVRGSEQIRRRVVQAGTLDVVGCILEAWLASKGFAVGPSSSVTGIPRETREQRHARRQAAIESRQREEALALTRALQRTQIEQMQLMQQQHQASQIQQTQTQRPISQTSQARVQPMVQTTRLHETQTTQNRREQSVAEEDEPMDVSPGPDASIGVSTASTLFTTPRPSTSTSTSNSDTDLSTNNSTAATPPGSGTPTGVVVIPNRERSGTVIARPVWDNNTTNATATNTNTTIPAAQLTLQPQRSSNLSNSTIVNATGRLRTTGSPSPSPSTDTSRPETETEDDGDVEGTEDVDMEDTTQSTLSSIDTTLNTLTNPVPSTSASTSVSASPSPERQPPTTSSPAHRTRHSLSRRAVGIVSENAPATQTLTGLEPTHHFLINEDLDNLGVGVGVGVNVGVEDGIVSLDQQATEDFAMGAPPGAPGAIETTPRFSVGVGRHGHGHGQGHVHHTHSHSHNHNHAHQAPDVTPRAAVIGLPPTESPSPTATSRRGGGVGIGMSGVSGVGMRSRAGTAPEPYTEPLIPTAGPSSGVSGAGSGNVLGLGPRTSSGSNIGVIPSSSAGQSATATTSSTLGTGIGSSSTTTSTTYTNQNPVTIPSPVPVTATNTISSTGSTSSNTTTPSTSATATTTPTYPGPYRDEDVLLGLQLLAYLSKYPHVRQAFYKPRQSFHPATLAHQQGSGSGGTVGGGSASGKGKAPMIPPPTQKDGSYFKTFNGSSVMAPNALPVSGGGARLGKERAVSGVVGGGSGPAASSSSLSSPSSSTPAGVSGSGGTQQRLTNVFSLVERFTFKPSSSELAANGGAVPRLPPEIQYWAGVVMRNACRKDDNRGGIRQCANMLCGRWEAYPREFAKCRRCRKAKYCGKECQSTAWSEGHRFWCSAKDVDDENAAGNHGSAGHGSSHHGHGHGHGHSNAHAHGQEGGDEEDSGGRRERRERRERERERERERREDGADTATQVPRVSRRTAIAVSVVGEPPVVRPPAPSSPIEGRRRAETVTGAAGANRTAASHDMVLG